MLDRRNQSLQDIVETLRIYHDNVDDEPEPEPPTADGELVDVSPSRTEILRGLITALSPPQPE